VAVERSSVGITEWSVPTARAGLQQVMTAEAGVLRSADSLGRAAEGAAWAAGVASLAGPAADGSAAARSATTEPAVDELRNLATVAGALVAGATARAESRGAHARSDCPVSSDDHRVRYVVGGTTR
jgi:L-aspartate oxidase